jgi:hypothetical protein
MVRFSSVSVIFLLLFLTFKDIFKVNRYSKKVLLLCPSMAGKYFDWNSSLDTNIKFCGEVDNDNNLNNLIMINQIRKKFRFKDVLRFVKNSLFLCINFNTKLVNSRQIEGHP